MTETTPPTGATGTARETVPALSWALLAGAGLLAITDVAAVLVGVSMPAGGATVRGEHVVFDVTETVGIGALAAVAVALYARFVKLPRWAAVGLAMAATMALLHDVVGDHLRRGVEISFHGHAGALGYAVYLVGLGFMVPRSYVVASRFATRPRARLPMVAFALALLAADQFPLRDDYQGMHALLACELAILGGAAAGPWLARRCTEALSSRRGRMGVAGAAVIALLGVVVPPPNAVRIELFRQPCAVAPWVLATLLWRAPSLHTAVPPPSSPWFRDRSGEPPVPPTSPRLLSEAPVVVLLTIDAVRADAVSDPANAALFPTLTALARDGVTFTQAHAAGSQTAVSLSALFSGRPFSEQLWTEHGTGASRFLYPAEDPAPRFPELLTARGVHTASFDGLTFLAGEYGVARGFREESVVVQGIRHAEAKELVDRLLGRLRRLGPGPAFLYTHLMEPHEPYDRGRKDGTDRERYLSEIAVADAEVARVQHALEARFPGRWALFVSADHGEAFGDHGTWEHGKSLYEELLHVPLFAVGPAFRPRVVSTRVSLVDLGPTMLDIFGVETPANFVGQSLVPLLAGRDVALDRPLFAEGRLRRELTTADGLSVIEDLRRKTVEVYDLDRDPGQARNLFDAEPARSDVALAALRAFFGAHTRSQGGYVPPFTP